MPFYQLFLGRVPITQTKPKLKLDPDPFFGEGSPSNMDRTSWYRLISSLLDLERRPREVRNGWLARLILTSGRKTGGPHKATHRWFPDKKRSKRGVPARVLRVKFRSQRYPDLRCPFLRFIPVGFQLKPTTKTASPLPMAKKDMGLGTSKMIRD